jgi:hypothetical protein
VSKTRRDELLARYIAGDVLSASEQAELKSALESDEAFAREARELRALEGILGYSLSEASAKGFAKRVISASETPPPPDPKKP